VFSLGVSIPLHLRHNAVGPLCPQREREWRDPFREDDPPEFHYDDNRRRLKRYLWDLGYRRDHGIGRREWRRCRDALEWRHPMFMDERDWSAYEEWDIEAEVLRAIAVCAAHADLMSGPAPDGADGDDDARARREARLEPPGAAVVAIDAVHELIAAPAAPPTLLVV
jgi:hypothetical protein